MKKMLAIPFHKAHITDDEINAAADAMRSGWLTMGKVTVEFEEKFKEYVGSPQSVSVNSATSALHLALKAIGLKQDDEVIMPTTTFVATAEVVTYFGGRPVLCDIDRNTHNIDVLKIEALITDKTKAIIPVHFAGQPCDMDEIYEISNRYKLRVIEDAAHALPSHYKGDRIGSLKGTDVTCFSFYATKTLTTGEGGMVTTSNTSYAENMAVNRLHGLSKDAWKRYDTKSSWQYDVIDNGFKYNTSDINSAIGLVQLAKQDLLRDKRLKIAEKYNNAFKDNEDIIIPFIKDDRYTSWHLYVIKIKERDEVFERLKELGIGCSLHFIPIHKHSFYKKKFNYNDVDYSVANKVFDESLSLPIYPDMTDLQVDHVISELTATVAYFKSKNKNI
jgi:dTDP-4-amino-4,6-dideoxygalactose transaminase